MHSEHLQNVSALWVFLGWLVAIAATSVVVVALSAAGLMRPDGTPVGWAWLSVAIGFWVGGYLTGTRDIEAPILHGVGIGLMTLVAWFILNVLVAFLGDGSWIAVSALETAGVLVLQMAAAVAGSWIADRRALRGGDLTGGELGS